MASHNDDARGHPQSTAKIAGHPLHPMLVQFPIVCFILTFVFDILYTQGRTDVAQWTIWLLGIGLGMGALAAVAGLTDFLGEKRIQGADAIKHALANVTAVVLEVVNLVLRLRSTESIGSTGVYISLVVAVIQQKTGRPVQFEITEQTRRSLADWLRVRKQDANDWLFPSRMTPGAHLSTRQYFRLVKGWIRLIGLEPADYGTHSLRRTKVSMLYRKTGNLRACQLLLGHTKLESTVRYLGVELDDALALSEALEI